MSETQPWWHLTVPGGLGAHPSGEEGSEEDEEEAGGWASSSPSLCVLEGTEPGTPCPVTGDCRMHVSCGDVATVLAPLGE